MSETFFQANYSASNQKKTNPNSNKYVRLRGLTYIHICWSDVHTLCKLDRHVSHKSLEASHYNKGTLADSFDFGLQGELLFPKMGDSPPWTPMNRRAKFDAASFILGGEIRNHTNKQTHKMKNSKRYIHTLPIGMCE